MVGGGVEGGGRGREGACWDLGAWGTVGKKGRKRGGDRGRGSVKRMNDGVPPLWLKLQVLALILLTWHHSVTVYVWTGWKEGKGFARQQ